jgi:hypothetical protein
MPLRALRLLFPLMLAACASAQEAKGPVAQASLTSADAAAPVAKEAPRAVRTSYGLPERDACTAYADCIDEGPASDPDEGGMHASSATIRSWEKSSEQLRQCAAAHDLARAGGLCR